MGVGRSANDARVDQIGRPPRDTESSPGYVGYSQMRTQRSNRLRPDRDPNKSGNGGESCKHSRPSPRQERKRPPKNAAVQRPGVDSNFPVCGLRFVRAALIANHYKIFFIKATPATPNLVTASSGSLIRQVCRCHFAPRFCFSKFTWLSVLKAPALPRLMHWRRPCHHNLVSLHRKRIGLRPHAL